MSGDLKLVRDRSVHLERLLDGLGASGRGLGEKFRSLELPDDLQRDLMQVNHLRNSVIHDAAELSPADLRRFDELSQRTSNRLSTLSSRRPQAAVKMKRESGNRLSRRRWLLMILFVVVGVSGLMLNDVVFKLLGMVLGVILIARVR